MQLTLQVDGHQLSERVEDLLRDLPQEKLQDLTKEVLASVLRDVDREFDRKYIEAKAVSNLQSSGYYRGKDEEYIRKQGEYKIRREMEKVGNVRQQLITQIIDGVVKQAKAEITSLIASDAVVQQVISETLATVRAEFPTYVRNAMTLYLAEQMKQTMSEVAASTFDKQHMSNVLQALDKRLTSKGI